MIRRYQILIKYVIAGLSGAVIQFSSFYFFTEVMEIWYLYAVFLAFVVTLIVVFLIHKFWTFSLHSKVHMKKQFLGYTLVAIGTILLNALIMRVLVGSFGVNHLIAQAVTILAITPVSYLVNRNLVFIAPTDAEGSHHHSHI